MKVYVYKEFCDSEAYGEEIIKVYANKEDALKKLRNRVEEYCECPFEDIPTKFDLDDDDLTLREDYVSMYVGKDMPSGLWKKRLLHQILALFLVLYQKSPSGFPQQKDYPKNIFVLTDM